MGHKTDWSAITNKIKTDEAKKGFKKDERFWKHTPDKEGNATAIIRFLPMPDSDENQMPYAKYYQHNFSYMDNNVKKYWIRNCLNTFGYERECPICRQNSVYWKSAFESDKKIASERKRKLTFVSNILVIKNPNNPEDEGKVFLYQYGQKIYDKIHDKWFPSDEMKALGEGSYEEYVPFDLEDGADFKLIVSKQGEFPNYDKSEFGKQKPVGNDKFIQTLKTKLYSLDEFMKEDKYPTNEEVMTKLGKALQLQSGATPSVPVVDSPTIDDSDIDDITSGSIMDTIADSEPTIEAEANEPITPADDANADDMAQFFKSLQ